MIFVDASAIEAILSNEPERDRFIEICRRDDCVTSSIALYEAALALCRKTTCSIDRSIEDLRIFPEEVGIMVVAVDPGDFAVALDAAKRFGKGQGHPARLNLGDCFAYACTVRMKARLLYKGDDFARTDVPSALT